MTNFGVHSMATSEFATATTSRRQSTGYMMTKPKPSRSRSIADASHLVSDAVPRCTCPQHHHAMATTSRVNYLEVPTYQSKPSENQSLSMDEREMYERAIEDLKRQLSEKDHQMTLYQTQLGVWMEDFKQERKDREKAQSKVIDLEKELILYKDLINDQTRHHATAAHKRRQEALTRIRREYYGSTQSEPQYQQYHQPPVFRNRGGGIVVCDGDEERPLAEDEDIIDTLVEPEITSSSRSSSCSGSTSSSSSSSSSSKRDLECPKCALGFDIAQHVEFLDHIDQCTE